MNPKKTANRTLPTLQNSWLFPSNLKLVQKAAKLELACGMYNRRVTFHDQMEYRSDSVVSSTIHKVADMYEGSDSGWPTGTEKLDTSQKAQQTN